MTKSHNYKSQHLGFWRALWSTGGLLGRLILSKLFDRFEDKDLLN